MKARTNIFFSFDDVVLDGVPQYGTRKLIRGETSFFLQPGETIGPVRRHTLRMMVYFFV
jgi:hypothetical protein